MAVTHGAQERLVPLGRIRVPGNVRELDASHVDALAGSIALQGMLVPLVVRAEGERFELVAGFHRIAAAHKLGLTEVPAVVRDAASEDADRAVENIARKQLNPYEEARAVKAMLARGLSEDGAAQALGWPKARVTARIRLLELPDRAQQMVGEDELSLSCVDVLREIGEVSRPIQELVVEYLDHDDTAWARDRLEGEAGWVIGQAIHAIGSSKTWAEYLTGFGTRAIGELKLGKVAEEQMAEVDKLLEELNPYAYASQLVRFIDAEIDQARAAGVLIEFEHGAPIITDRKLYRELVKQALKRAVQEYRDKAAAAKDAKAAARKRSGSRPDDPLAQAKRAHRETMREFSDQAHGVNLDLGASLINGLSRVDPNDMAVARFFVLCRRPHRTNYADRLTMRISRCHTRGNGDEAGRGAAKARSGRAGGGGRIPARLGGPLPRGRRDLRTPADLGREGPA
jgi:ParB/RepB/Spo0J family partition protein